MPKLKRSAEPLTVEAVLEDLKLTREVGGIQRAGSDELHTVAQMMFPDEEEFHEDHLRYARSLVETHINKACEALGEVRKDEPCARATADSLRALFFQSDEDRSKAETLRKQALSDRGCALSTDGLRKREDSALGVVAKLLHEDLQERQGHAPQTVEEIVRVMRPLVTEAREFFHYILQLIYPYDPPPTSDERITYLMRGMWYLANLQMWARSMQTLRLRPTKHSRWEVLFGDLFGGVILLLGFEEQADKDTVYAVMRESPVEDYIDLWNRLYEKPGWEDMANRWQDWMQSCFPHCTYHRSITGVRCAPHQLLIALEEFERAAIKMDGRELDEEFQEYFGANFPIITE